MAEAALADAHATASRLLQECGDARRANQELQGRVNTLKRQLQGGHLRAPFYPGWLRWDAPQALHFQVLTSGEK